MLKNSASSDFNRIVTAQALRAFAYGFTAIIIGRTLAEDGASPFKVGLLLSCIFLGTALSSLALIPLSHLFSRKKLYELFYLLLVLSGLIIGFYPHAITLAIIGLTGVLSTDANDNGAATTLEQTMLAQGISKSTMVKTFGRYNAIAALSGGLGSILQGLVGSHHLPFDGFQGFFVLAFVGIGGVLLSRSLTPSVELTAQPLKFTTIREATSRGNIFQLSALFSLDAAAGGLVSSAFLSYYLTIRYHAAPTSLGYIFFITSIMNSLSMVTAPILASRIGLVWTMVSTHLLSNLFIIIAAFCGNFPLAVLFLILRSAFSQMDIPTRQALIANVVPEDERMAASAILNTSRNVVRPVSPIIGALSQHIFLGLPLIICGALKVIYDLGVYSWAKHHDFLVQNNKEN